MLGRESASKRVASHVKRLVAIGDVHGDIGALYVLLTSLKLIDSSQRWIGQDAVLVLSGNLIDVGPYDLEVLLFVEKLRRTARVRGGDVVTLLGLSEIGNAIGAMGMAHPESIRSFGGLNTRQRMFMSFGPAGTYRRQLAQDYPFIFVSNKHAFVHPGLLYTHGKLGTEKINTLFKEGFDKSKALRNHKPLHELLINHWYNQTRFVQQLHQGECEDLHKTLEALHVDFMVYAGRAATNNQTLPDHIQTFCQGRAIDVNVGLSRWIKGSLGALEVILFQNGSIHQREVRADDKTSTLSAWHHNKVSQDKDGENNGNVMDNDDNDNDDDDEYDDDDL